MEKRHAAEPRRGACRRGAYLKAARAAKSNGTGRTSRPARAEKVASRKWRGETEGFNCQLQVVSIIEIMVIYRLSPSASLRTGSAKHLDLTALEALTERSH